MNGVQIFCDGVSITLFTYTGKGVLLIRPPTEITFSHIICGEKQQIQLCLLCCEACRGGGNLWFNFKFHIFYSGTEVSVAHSKITAGP